MEIILSFLPKNISDQIQKIPPNQLKEIEEIRFESIDHSKFQQKDLCNFLPYTVQPEDALPFIK